jgi:hypothetical protein
MHLASLLHRITALEMRSLGCLRLSSSQLQNIGTDIPYHNRWLWPFLPRPMGFHKDKIAVIMPGPPCSTVWV